MMGTSKPGQGLCLSCWCELGIPGREELFSLAAGRSNSSYGRWNDLGLEFGITRDYLQGQEIEEPGRADPMNRA